MVLLCVSVFGVCVLVTQGQQRQSILEKAVSEAQSSETRVQNFQQWICHVDDLLNEYLDNDTTMDDLPHDFQVSESDEKMLLHEIYFSIHFVGFSSLFELNFATFSLIH